MQNMWLKISRKPLSYLGSFSACAVLGLTTACASGGFHLTRQYAGWVNSQTLILRIILYILTGVVFAVTLLIDMVVFNTIDFWDGKVSAGEYNFNQGDKTYVAKHEFLPETGLKRSTIRVFDARKALLQEVVLSETPAGEIEMYLDGKLKTRVHSLSEAPIASIYDRDGKLVSESVLLLAPTLANR